MRELAEVRSWEEFTRPTGTRGHFSVDGTIELVRQVVPPGIVEVGDTATASAPGEVPEVPYVWACVSSGGEDGAEWKKLRRWVPNERMEAALDSCGFFALVTKHYVKIRVRGDTSE